MTPIKPQISFDSVMGLGYNKTYYVKLYSASNGRHERRNLTNSTKSMI